MSKSSFLPAPEGRRASVSRPRSRGVPARVARAACLIAPLSLAFVAGVSCVDPQQDYNDYVARAADAQVPSVTPVGTADAAEAHAADASFDSKSLVMACVTNLGFSAAQALHFKASLDYVDGPSGRNVTLTITPLDKTATTIASPLSPTSMGSASVDSHGGATVNIGSTTIPAAANAVSGQAVSLQDTVLTLEIQSPTQICGNLGAMIVEPPDTLQPAQTPCVFRETDASGSWVPFVISDFHCP